VSTDGIEAVQKAAELRPKIVLLDIGLPRLNGIEAAKRIRKNSCDCKIIFLTANGDREIKKTALELGAEAYVTKDNAVRKLLPAIADALRNRV
jgi:DNA-binding response OmpR family regulator